MQLKKILLNDFLSLTQDIAYYLDLKTNKIEWSGPFHLIFDKTYPPSILEEWYQYFCTENLSARLKKFSRYCKIGGVFSYDLLLKKNNGQWEWFQEKGSIDCIEKPSYFLGTLRVLQADIHNQESSEALGLAYYDDAPSAGLLNKYHFKEALSRSIEEIFRKQEKGMCLFLTINHLCSLNLIYSIEIMDQVIRDFVKCVWEWLSNKGYILGRISGNCFGIIMKKVDHQEIASLMSLFSLKFFETEKGPIQITVSMGGVHFFDFQENVEGIINKGKIALRQAKDQGINSFKIYDLSAEYIQEQYRNIQVTTCVYTALAENRCRICYQPVYRADQTVAFYEALIRICDLQGTLISAAKFMPTAEQWGMAPLLDRWIMEAVVQEVIAYPDICIALNISGYTINNEEWLTAFKNALKLKPEAAQQLIIEITETAAIIDLEQAVNFIQELKQRGCHISLDDFGVGYTSFLHMKMFPLDSIKIDASYIQGLEKNSDNFNFIKALLSLTTPKGIKIVAEGIETVAVFDLLKSLHIDYYQGYFLGKPALQREWLREQAF